MPSDPPSHVLGPKTVHVGDDDHRSTAERLIGLLAEQMRTSFELLGADLRNGLRRIEKRIDAQDDSIAEHGRDIADHGKDIADLKQRVSTLEARKKPPTKKKRI